MKIRPVIQTLSLLACVVTLSCRTHEDLAARYLLEQKLWNAQVLERKININFLRASQKDLHLALEAFDEVVAYDPLSVQSTAGWDSSVVRDIRRIRLVSKIALANLYFLSERYYYAGDFYSSALEESGLSFEKRLDVRLNLVRTMHLAGESEALEINCARIFKDIAESDYFWAGRSQLKDVFLNIPLVLARIYRDRGDQKKYEEYVAVAHNFYSKIAATWPDSLIAARARFSMANLYLVQEQWESALREVNRLIDYHGFEEQRGNLLLLKGEILAFAMDNTTSGRAVFGEIVRDYPGTHPAHAAQLNLATLELNEGKTESGLGKLREIETSESATPEIVAKAMLVRALFLEANDRWDEAIVILRRITGLYPYTSSAIESPIVITRHHVAKGDQQLAGISLERAKEFYLSLIARQSKYGGDRLKIEDFLIENYLMVGRAAEVASLLENESSEWDEASTAGGLFKSALVYSEVLDDKENAVRILKKCIALFPETRYAKMAQRQIERLEEG